MSLHAQSAAPLSEGHVDVERYQNPDDGDRVSI